MNTREQFYRGRWVALSQTRHGAMLFNKNDLFIGRSLDLYGEWGESELRLLCPRILPGDCVVDAGAYIGTHTLAFAHAVGTAGSVIAVEPRLDAFALLRSNVLLNGLGQVACLKVAAGHKPAMVDFALWPPSAEVNHGGGRRLRPDEDVESREAVASVPIDSFDLEDVSLIKGDVEGDELRLLAGATHTIHRCRPDLFLEWNDGASVDLEPVYASLHALEYDCFWHVAPMYSPDNYAENDFDVFNLYDPQANLLCVHRSKPERMPRCLLKATAGETWRAAVARGALEQSSNEVPLVRLR